MGMEMETLAILLLALIAWRVFYPAHTVELVSPIFKNSKTKEIGAWAYYKMKVSALPYPGLLVNVGNGDVCRILEVQFDKFTRDISCTTYMEQPFCNDDEQYEHMKKNAKECGWRIREVKPHILHWWKEEYESIDMAADYKSPF